MTRVTAHRAKVTRPASLREGGRYFKSLTEHVPPIAEHVVFLGEVGGDLDDDEWSILKAIADGITHEELSRELGVSVRSLRTRVCRIRSRIRDKMRLKIN